MSRVLQKYNNKVSQKYKAGKHNGIDIIGDNGKSNNSGYLDYIIAHTEGEVVGVVSNYKTNNPGSRDYGNYVKIKHPNGYYTLYAHMKYGSVTVKKGDKVEKGQVIGYMGNTGNSYGAHLHFEVRDTSDTKIDPTPYIDADLPSVDVYTTFVRNLQAVIGANVDGIAGPETLSKTPTISTSTGWNHKAVRPLQVYLQSLGYDLGSCGVDGKFGKDMKACIKKYQKDVGLASKYQDGIVTAKMYTWKKLLKLD